MRLQLMLLKTLILIISVAGQGRAAQVIPFVTDGLQAPVLLTAPAGEHQRCFILEQPGRIRVVKDGFLLPTPFLDIVNLVDYGGEAGLLGLAFHPNYAGNRYFYVNYTSDAGGQLHTVIARYRAVAGNPDLADAASGTILLSIDQPYSNHNGGMIAFGPDGYLYIGMGDGGSSGDPHNNGQGDQTLLGKMLRIDVNAGPPYGIPPSNPFVGLPPRDEIWAKGLRNPWRFSFDRLTGDLWIGDVGQGQWEEVDFQPASSDGGENYGWKIMEGAHCFSPPNDCDDAGLTYPVHEYPHDPDCSITGGYVYRGAGAPELYGRYLFADYCTGNVWALDPANFTATRILIGANLGNPSSFGEDAAGNVYILDHTGDRVLKLMGDDPSGVPEGGRTRLGLSVWPNPFSAQTQLRLERDSEHALDAGVYDVGGRLLRRLSAPAGARDLSWDGRDETGTRLPAGIYYVRVRTDAGREIAAPLTLLR